MFYFVPDNDIYKIIITTFRNIENDPEWFRHCICSCCLWKITYFVIGLRGRI